MNPPRVRIDQVDQGVGIGGLEFGQAPVPKDECGQFMFLGAENGPQGLEMMRREKPDLVLLDVGLPGMDGLRR